MSHTYQAFGLCIILPIATDQLLPAPPAATPDIQVTFGPTPSSLPRLHQAGWVELQEAQVEISHNGDMLWITARTRYWAHSGNTVIVEAQPQDTSPAPTLDRAQLHFILNNCLPALLNQRGDLALHANALLGPHRAIALMGHSGAGKSTLLAALVTRGWPMLADDVTVLRRGEGERPWVQPGYPTYRLCADTLEQFSPIAERMVAVGGIRNKVMVVVPPATLHATPVPLHAIYVLRVHDADDLQIHRVEGLQAFHLIRENSYSPAAMLRSPHAFTNIQQVIQNCVIYEIYRPANRWTIDEIITHLAA